MPALTPKERQQRRREKLKASGQYEAYKAKNTQYSKKYRTKMKTLHLKLSSRKKEALLTQKRAKDRERQQKCRSLKRQTLQNQLVETPCSSKVNKQDGSPLAYSNKQSFSRAMNRTKAALPKSPRKKRAVIRKLALDFTISMTWPKKKPRITTLVRETVDLVQNFYKRDDISRISPGKRDVVTVRDANGKAKLQKRHMIMSIKETYALFKEESPHVKIGLSKFAELRPADVLLSSQTPINVCQCLYHQNFILAIDALHGYIPTIPSYTKDFPASCLMSPDDKKCWFSECSHDLCGFGNKYPLPDDPDVNGRRAKWMKWQSVEGRLVKCEEIGTVEELYQYVQTIVQKFLTHCFIKRQQSMSYESDKSKASESVSTTAVLQMDFAENFTCTAQDEIQSAHWNQAQVTLYTSVMWFRDKITSHVIVSDYMSHDKTAVVVFLDELLSTSHDQNIKEIRIWTDGPASQFKNRYVMNALPVLSKKHGVDLVWNFSATSHGKGPVDGVGGSLKRTASEKIKTRKCTIYTAKDFCAAVRGSKIQVTLLFEDTINERQKSLNLETLFEQASAIKGISSMHYVAHDGMQFVTKTYTAETDADATDDACTSTTQDSAEDAQAQGIDNSILHVCHPKVNEMAAVALSGKHPHSVYVYMAQVLKVDGNDVCVRYLQKNGNLYSWPVDVEESWQPVDDILCTVPQPNLMNNRGQLQFSEEIIESAKRKALNRPRITTVFLK